MAKVYKTVGYKKRHYEDFARILGDAAKDPKNADCVSEITARVIRLFSEDNARFDRERFIARWNQYAHS